MPDRLRDDLESLKARVARLGGSGMQATTFVGVTHSDGDYPATAGAFYLVHPAAVDGEEVEGAPWTAAVDGDKAVYAFNLGSTVPAPGTKVLVFHVPNRWVFFHD